MVELSVAQVHLADAVKENEDETLLLKKAEKKAAKKAKMKQKEKEGKKKKHKKRKRDDNDDEEDKEEEPQISSKVEESETVQEEEEIGDEESAIIVKGKKHKKQKTNNSNDNDDDENNDNNDNDEDLTTTIHIKELERRYHEALKAFKADGKSNKDLRRAKSIAKKAWEDAIIANAGPNAEALTCRNCSHIFLFYDSKLYKKRRWMTKPTQCEKCSNDIKLIRSQNVDRRSKIDSKQKDMCYEFTKTGKCRFGDCCKFSHALSEKQREEQQTQKETRN